MSACASWRSAALYCISAIFSLSPKKNPSNPYRLSRVMGVTSCKSEQEKITAEPRSGT
jgi:hypothetical protein